MNDKELTELAAKAFGASVEEFSPLTDDGDALRLAVKLGMDIEIGTRPIDLVEVSVSYDCTVFQKCERLDADPYAATRRAIVRAAAAIGEKME